MKVIEENKEEKMMMENSDIRTNVRGGGQIKQQ